MSLLALAACGRNPLDLAPEVTANATIGSAGTTGGQAGTGIGHAGTTGGAGAAAGTSGNAGGGAGANGVAGTGAAGRVDAGVDLAPDTNGPDRAPSTLPGAACKRDAECMTGICADGVCCNGRCDGPCVSCRVAGSQGVCANVPAGTRCGDAKCDRAVLSMAPTCDGKGVCATPSRLNCDPFACDAANGRCFSACETDAHCANAVCTHNICLHPFHTPCAIDAECASGHCVAGDCCDTACTGPCVSCKLPGRLGACSPSPPGTVCSAPKCSGATFTPAGTCSSTGACEAPSISCAPFTCRDDVPMCHSGCPAGDSICVPGSYCSGDEVCSPKKLGGERCQSDHECVTNQCVSRGAFSTCFAPA